MCCVSMQVYEILDNAIDEIQGGYATNVRVELDLDSGWVSISDDGRGIPTSTHPATGKSALETVLTVLHAGGKFGGQGSGYSVSGGLHGVGISVVNALSEQLHAAVWCVQCAVLMQKCPDLPGMPAHGPGLWQAPRTWQSDCARLCPGGTLCMQAPGEGI